MPPVRPLSLVLAALALAVGSETAKAQAAPESRPTAKKEIVLGTLTPLGEASITIPAGSVLTNQETQGDKIRIWQGPFSTTVGIEAVQMPQPPAENPAQDPSPETKQEECAQKTSPPETAAEQTPAAPPAAPEPATVDGEPAIAALPEWAVPAAGGALLAYAILTTVALLRSRNRAETKTAPISDEAKKETATPVVAIGPKKNAVPAVVSDGGRSIACPLCAKSIPLEKISKGRNVCPSCGGAFVGE